jgi:L-fuculose-phosphate aldolase
MSENTAQKAIIETGRRLYSRGLISGSDGNLSVRPASGNILITASGVSKGFLEKKHLVEIDFNGKVVSGSEKPSSEYRLHLFVYQNRPDVGACCHAHPPHATAFAVIRQELDYRLLPEVVLGVGRIPLTPYAPPGTEAVGDSLADFIENNNAFLLSSHGVLTLGPDLTTAMNRMETVEHLAKIVYISKRIGKLNYLDDKEIDRLEKIRRGQKR